MEKQNNTTTTPEVVSYEQSKIQLIFNILNSVNFVGIQQAQAIAQIAVILSQPITDDNDNEEIGNKESGDK